MIASGMLLGLMRLRSLDAVWMTPYGRLLSLKLALLLPLFTLALLNRFHLTEPAERGNPGALRSLRRSIGTELLLVAAILAAASGLRLASAT